MTLGWRFRRLAAAALVLASCEAGTSPEVAKPELAAVAQAATAQCAGTDVHTKHVNQFACSTCHPQGGEFGAGGTLPNGTPVTGTIALGSPTTCAVSCHGSETVAWNQTNVSCVSCHAAVVLAGARSTHLAATDRATCLACHDVSAHLSGEVRLSVGDGTPGNAGCLACHLGSGNTIAGKAPPPVVEFAAGGADAHGEGGDAPAQGCSDCHDPHASTNVFLLGRRADTAPLPANAIASRAGIGSEALCGRCHAARHQSCLVTCHAHMPGGHVTDPVPNGGACFACHGHEGVVRGEDQATEWETPDYWGFFSPDSCTHCHGTNLPGVEAMPPDVGAPIFSNDGAATATVTWTSGEPANSWIEYREAGATDSVRVAGNAQFRVNHAVQLTGLGAGVTYDVRIRTSDRMRNLGFGTSEAISLGAPSTPTAMPVSDNLYSCTASAPVTFTWSASNDPDGDPLVYQLQVSTSPGFETLALAATTPAGATSHTASLPAPGTTLLYHWRVRARDPQGLVSTWSATDSFYLRQYVDEACF